LRLGALSPFSRLQHPSTNPIVHFECVWKRGRPHRQGEGATVGRYSRTSATRAGKGTASVPAGKVRVAPV